MDPQKNQPPKVFAPNKDANENSLGPDYKSRGLASGPYSTAPQPPIQTQAHPPATSGAINDPPDKPGLKLPKGPVLAGIIGGVLIIILIVVVLIVSSGNKPKTTQKTNSADNSALTPALQPAQSVELEQTNNAITQDLSGLNDEKDLPNNSLDDMTLGL